jgi:hypothetical protein
MLLTRCFALRRRGSAASASGFMDNRMGGIEMPTSKKKGNAASAFVRVEQMAGNSGATRLPRQVDRPFPMARASGHNVGDGVDLPDRAFLWIQNRYYEEAARLMTQRILAGKADELRKQGRYERMIADVAGLLEEKHKSLREIEDGATPTDKAEHAYRETMKELLLRTPEVGRASAK